MNTRSIDFLKVPAPPRIGWVLLAAGAAALASALWVDKQWIAERQASARAEQAALAAQRVQQAPVPPTEPTLAQRRWQQAQPELRRPWLSTLRAVESAAVNPVFLLSMTIEPSKGLIKLDAEAPSFDHALAFVQVLDLGNALLPATLVSHEQVGDVGGRSAVKFSATTRWVAP
jgi:hypothetical protein